MPLKAPVKQIFWFLFFILFFGFLSVHFGEDSNWDFRNYHFYSAYAFLHHRIGWDLAPGMMQSYFNPFMDMFNYFFIMHVPPRVAAFIFGAVSGVMAFFVYQSGRLLFSKDSYALLVVLWGMTGVAGISQLGTTHNETKTAMLIIMALYFLLKMVSSQHKRSEYLFVLLSGLSIGFAVGLKLTAAPYGVAFAVAMLFYTYQKRRLMPVVIFVFASAFAFLVSDGPWLWIMVSHFQNPLFPYYNNIFHSPYAQNANYVDSRFHPHTMAEWIFLPFYLTRLNHLVFELTIRDSRLAIAYALAVIFIIYAYKKRPNISLEWKMIFIISLVSYVLWLIQFTIYRYAIPLEIFSALVSVYFISHWRAKSVLCIIFTVLLAFNTRYCNWGHVPFGKKYLDVPVPPVPPHALILMLAAPFSYVIPFFPSDSRFININSNLMSPTLHDRLQTEAREIIQSQPGALFSLSPVNQNNTDKSVLKYYDLVQVSSECKNFKTNLKGDLLLCPLKREENAL